MFLAKNGDLPTASTCEALLLCDRKSPSAQVALLINTNRYLQKTCMCNEEGNLILIHKVDIVKVSGPL